MKKTKIVFLGTPDFAVDTLRKLHDAFTVVAVVTQPDRPSGRGKKMMAPPVKQVAQELGLPVEQPQKIKNEQFLQWLKSLEPDFLVTAAYGRILPGTVLAVPKIAALNVHASLLPRWRGAAPIHRAVLAGDEKSGITIMHMDEGMDTGDMILQQAVPISNELTTGELHDQLAAVGGDLIVEAIEKILQGDAPRVPQDQSKATAAPPLTREEEQIDWCRDPKEVHNLVRGMNPWPGTYTFIDGQRLKIWSGKPAGGKGKRCGEVLRADGEGILVATKDGAYLITRLQPPGKKPMTAGDFLRGNELAVGTLLGK
ncbi:methionyl-tRNA formyltransferase [Dethiobacter alkaliphilus]|uniref:methionyl-tRNA formyltransferase n=1 Tax=Dethiobacter alkaliphilus TaxID=427926 RepID=UPI0022274B40|nr:methionyl-tRNA formyltransferase [Dethiobacter alkaliphilus]MCW3490899.1 methionyl-tRNA formyltransferase [Dethiobacter alkaliphilus]